MRTLLFCFFLLLNACGSPPSEKSVEKPLVLVSVAPFKYFVQKIGGERLRVQTIVPTGANAHSYEPSPREVTGLQKADVWFQIGETFEKKITPVLLQYKPDLILFDLRTTVPLLPFEDDTHSIGDSHHKCCSPKFDPHIWLSPKLAKVEAEKMAEILIQRFPQWKQEFRSNLENLQKELSTLDLEIANLVKNVPKRGLLVSHPAFGYFCKDFNFNQISVEYDGKDPLPQRLEMLVQQVSKENIDIVFLLPQYNNKGAKLIASKLELPSALVDPYSENYTENLRKIAHLIADDHE
jgi:zinc transport system substrate-binding protein